jgi:hypothetical protein
LKKEHKIIILRGEMVTWGVCSTLHQSDIPFSKGERLFKGISKAFRHGEQSQAEFKQGEQSQAEFKQGEQSQDENVPLPLMLKGES